MESSTPTATFYDGSSYTSQNSVGYWVKQAYVALQRSLDSRMQELDLTGMQWGPLWMISQGRADTVAGCAREACIDAGAMTRMIDRLEAKGLLLRQRSTEDRRVVHVVLTPRGQEVAARIPYLLADVMNRQLDGFTAAEVEQLLGLLRRFVGKTGPAACRDPS